MSIRFGLKTGCDTWVSFLRQLCSTIIRLMILIDSQVLDLGTWVQRLRIHLIGSSRPCIPRRLEHGGSATFGLFLPPHESLVGLSVSISFCNLQLMPRVMIGIRKWEIQMDYLVDRRTVNESVRCPQEVSESAVDFGLVPESGCSWTACLLTSWPSWG
jgi:hypothetical protein